MARNTKLLPELTYLQSVLRLSDKYPTGLEWAFSDGWRQEGDMAGRRSAMDKFWRVAVYQERFTCHRIVYYLRTGTNPGTADVFHGADNPERDNRKELFLLQENDVLTQVSNEAVRSRLPRPGVRRSKKKRKSSQDQGNRALYEDIQKRLEFRRDDPG
jgi:hypothetical protein